MTFRESALGVLLLSSLLPALLLKLPLVKDMLFERIGLGLIEALSSLFELSRVLCASYWSLSYLKADLVSRANFPVAVFLYSIILGSSVCLTKVDVLTNWLMVRSTPLGSTPVRLVCLPFKLPWSPF